MVRRAPSLWNSVLNHSLALSAELSASNDLAIVGLYGGARNELSLVVIDRCPIRVLRPTGLSRDQPDCRIAVRLCRVYCFNRQRNERGGAAPGRARIR